MADTQALMGVLFLIMVLLVILQGVIHIDRAVHRNRIKLEKQKARAERQAQGRGHR